MRTNLLRPKFLGSLALCSLLFAVAPVAAQSGTIQADLQADFKTLSEKLLSLAEAIPADKYGWRPSEGVRNVSESLMHVAAANYFFPTLVGNALPEGVNPRAFEQEITEHDEVISTFKGSLEALAAMLDTIDMEGEIEVFGQTLTKAGFLHLAISHNHEHLGQMIAYARSVGVVPPWSK